TGTIWQRVLGLIRSATTWRAVTWMLLRFPLGLASAVAVVSVAALGAALMAAPFDGAIRDPSAGVVAAALAGGAAVVALAFHLVDLLALVQRSLAHALLGPSQRERTAMLTARAEQADLRADLARELHDSVGHSVTAAVVQAAAAQRVLDE